MNSPQSLLLGITGGIACGKTETGRILAADGWQVLDTDVLAHEMMKPDGPVYLQVVEHFGTLILKPDGQIDRTKLGAIVFEDPQERERLNRLTHPPVIAASEKWIAGCREAGEDAAVLVPLLFEAGWTKGWDAIICVTAPEEQIFQRLGKRGLSNEEARKRIAAQIPQSEKAARSDFIIENGGTIEMLRNRIVDLIEQIRCENKEEL